MPSRNVIKQYQAECFYHVYNRGVNKQAIFIDDQDYRVFLKLLARLLGGKPEKDRLGREYKWYGDELELLAFCLMPNHFHLLLYQHDSQAITAAMKSLTLAYVSYFNKRHKRLGPLFAQRFRAAEITDDTYLQHISRYIHLNPDNYQEWQWSSLPFYKGAHTASWVKPTRIIELFDNPQQYLDFTADYKNYRDSLQLLKEIDY